MEDFTALLAAARSCLGAPDWPGGVNKVSAEDIMAQLAAVRTCLGPAPASCHPRRSTLITDYFDYLKESDSEPNSESDEAPLAVDSTPRESTEPATIGTEGEEGSCRGSTPEAGIPLVWNWSKEDPWGDGRGRPEAAY